ncbi:right-handed parallel beta-helix repeat-containing protein [Streptomyces johnsoniae]|uniref:Right-handed parallel beta-helix repeat-containing protein n=1 Tax=Streptomyces johnsoniae TaxID=3075532 RepID=A0ABU2SB14_9ACTN|nr:right-handed parallel beta-helix repeat-containing protein [Streptomyces sp. DSM 41886]MDT0444870.1 right-handed parallel beta-helix repeat-containing protein [Streptomyces sp. DSM 41886]
MGRRAALLSGIVSLVTAATLTGSVGAAAGTVVGAVACGGGTYQAEAVRNGNTWTAPGYSGTDMLSAMRAAVGSLPSDRTAKAGVLVRGSGDVPGDQSLDLPSYTMIDFCGTINVTGPARAGHAPLRTRNTTDVEIRNASLTGTPHFGILVRNGTDITMGQIDMDLSGGLGVRIDNHDDRDARSRNVRIGDVRVSGGGSHAVETYGVDGLTIGTVTARGTGESGLQLNDTVNARIGRVDGEGTGADTGYAAFRMGNRDGRIGDGYPTNIRVGEVIARGGGRGILCVPESGGAVIDRITISRAGGDAILVEDCRNVRLAARSSAVDEPGDVRIGAGPEPVTSLSR